MLDMKKPDAKKRQAATDIMQKDKSISRVSVDGEIVVEPHKPLLDIGGVSVILPPGSFTQATVRAEEAMAALVTAHLGKSKRVIDLFSVSAHSRSGWRAKAPSMPSNSTRRRYQRSTMPRGMRRG